MNTIDSQQNKQKNHQKNNFQGDRKPYFTIIHVDKNNPEAICIDLIDAKNEMAATTAAKRQFPNSTILRISSSDDGIEPSEYPDARFIKGEFRIASRANDQNS